jgi:prepilin-type N-terminal cleavage/methylation domain-containing protein
MNISKSDHNGFTLTEMLIVIVTLGIVLSAMYTFFSDSMNQYVKLQNDGIAFSEVSEGSQRISSVLRGITQIADAQAESLTMYAYFSPNDAHESLIKYYLNNDKTKLLADVIPCSDNYPNCTVTGLTPNVVTIINEFYKTSSPIFAYYNADNTQVAAGDYNTIKNIETTLAVKPNASNQDPTIVTNYINLRNKKTNL